MFFEFEEVGEKMDKTERLDYLRMLKSHRTAIAQFAKSQREGSV
jgi:hypothetical protein